MIGQATKEETPTAWARRVVHANFPAHGPQSLSSFVKQRSDTFQDCADLGMPVKVT